MNNSFGMGMLHGLTDLHEQAQSLRNRKTVLITECRDRDTSNQLHDEVWSAGFGHPSVKDLRDVGMIHHREGLSLGLEAGDHPLRIHACLNVLERNLTTHRIILPGAEHGPTASFADQFSELVS